MKQAIMAISCICLAAALCEQMLDGNRYFPAMRLALGMEMAAMAVSGLMRAWDMLNG